MTLSDNYKQLTLPKMICILPWPLKFILSSAYSQQSNFNEALLFCKYYIKINFSLPNIRIPNMLFSKHIHYTINTHILTQSVKLITLSNLPNFRNESSEAKRGCLACNKRQNCWNRNTLVRLSQHFT